MPENLEKMSNKKGGNLVKWRTSELKRACKLLKECFECSEYVGEDSSYYYRTLSGFIDGAYFSVMLVKYQGAKSAQIEIVYTTDESALSKILKVLQTENIKSSIKYHATTHEARYYN